MSEEKKKKKIAIIVSKGTLDMAYPPLILATAAVSMDMEAILFFTMWGLNLIKKGGAEQATLPTHVGVSAEAMNELIKKAGVLTVSEFIKMALDMGVKMYPCEQVMKLMGIKKEDLIEGVEKPIGAATFLDMALESDIVLFI